QIGKQQEKDEVRLGVFERPLLGKREIGRDPRDKRTEHENGRHASRADQPLEGAQEAASIGRTHAYWHGHPVPLLSHRHLRATQVWVVAGLPRSTHNDAAWPLKGCFSTTMWLLHDIVKLTYGNK